MTSYLDGLVKHVEGQLAPDRLAELKELAGENSPWLNVLALARVA